MCSKLIICFKTLLSRDEFMPMMKCFAELVLKFPFLTSCLEVVIATTYIYVQKIGNEDILSFHFQR